MRARPASAPDPGMIYTEAGNAYTAVYKDLTGKSLRTLSINPAEKTLVLIIAGQSLSTGLTTATYNPTNTSKLDNFNAPNGLMYDAKNVLLGTTWNGSLATSANFNLAIADGVISNGKFNRVILVPVAIPGSSLATWTTNVIGTDPVGYYRAINSAILKLASQGVTPSTPGVSFLIKWNQGESDCAAGTSQAAYTASFQKLMALCPCPGAKWMIARETWINGVTSASIQAAQAALVDNVTVFAGENMDSIGSGGRVDNTHLNQSGHDLAYPMGVSAITAITF